MSVRVLVTGASGMLGTAVVAGAPAAWQIAALAHRYTVAGTDVIPGDLEDAASLAAAVARARPQVVVHAAAWTDVDACEREPDRARRLHVDATGALAAAARGAGAGFVYLSTDAGFDGPGLHGEDARLAPRSVYACTKLDGERAALAAHPDALIVRTCIVGWGARPGAGGLVAWALAELRAGRAITGFADVRFTPALSTTVAAALVRLIDAGADGVFHVAGPECVSKLAFCRALAAAFDLPAALVVDGRLADRPPAAPRPASPCLDPGKYARWAGAPLPPLADELAELRRQESSGWLDAARSRLRPL